MYDKALFLKERKQGVWKNSCQLCVDKLQIERDLSLMDFLTVFLCFRFRILLAIQTGTRLSIMT